MDKSKIGSLLQDLRKQKSLTQQKLATELNVTPQSVSKWEKGDSIPDIAILSALAKFYQITIDEIINGELNISYENTGDSLYNDQLWMISRLVSSAMILLSLFLFYINEKINFSDIMPIGSEWEPFNLSKLDTKVPVQGVHLIFNTTNITVFNVGAWIIFLPLLFVITLFTLEVISIVKIKERYGIINKNIYHIAKTITEITILVGFIILFGGVVFINSITFNIGYFIGLLFTFGLFGINYVEYKKII